MDREKETTILVKESTWSRLNAYRKLGEHMDDVVTRALNALDKEKQK